MQYTENFSVLKIENFIGKLLTLFFNICAQNIVGTRGEAVLTSTHNLCCKLKIRKCRYTPVNTSFTNVNSSFTVL